MFPTWCHQCHVRVAPFDKDVVLTRVKFGMNWVDVKFHNSATSKCYDKWMAAKLKKLADVKK